MILILLVLFPPIIGWLLTEGTKMDYLMLYGIAAFFATTVAVAEFVVPDGRRNEGDQWWALGCTAVLWFCVYVLSR